MDDKKRQKSPPAKPCRRDSDMAPGFSMAKVLLSNALPRSVYYPGDDAREEEP